MVSALILLSAPLDFPVMAIIYATGLATDKQIGGSK
jgi:hypothetical protein